MTVDEPIVTIADGNVLHAAYQARVDAGEFKGDASQLQLVHKLDKLLLDLEDTRLASKQSALGWLFSKKQSVIPNSRGLYIWGAVGRGKTMLMDEFYYHVAGITKRRVHFYDFMLDAHERIHAHRKLLAAGKTIETDPVPPVARALARQARLLCFDEFSITDVADAMILSRLFTTMFEHGVTVVATSNIAPDALYPNGLNRNYFLSFVTLLKKNVEVFRLDARVDFRLEKLTAGKIYITGDAGGKQLDQIWQEMTGTVEGEEDRLTIKGRQLTVPQAARGAARFSFEELCNRPLAAGDYLALARRYHTLFVDNIPKMSREMRNQAKRFIMLIDTLYDHHINLLCTAAVEPNELYTATSGTEYFEFNRTVSRLIEMQSREYLEKSRSNRRSA